MKKGVAIFITVVIVLIIIIFSMILTTKDELNDYYNDNKKEDTIKNATTNLFYQYSDKDNIFSWNLYNGKTVSFDFKKTGYLYYVLNKENQNNKENQLLISMGDFPYWFSNNLKYSSNIFNGKVTEKKLDLGSDLRDNWSRNKNNYPISDIKNKYNIERKVTLKSSYNDKNEKTEYYTNEYYSSYMDIYVNSDNTIIYALPQDIRSISYVSKDEVNTNAVEENKIMLDAKKNTNINNIIDSLGEPSYAIVTNDSDSSNLTYVWYIFDNYYFFYTMQVNYYLESMLPGDDDIKSPLSGSNISDFKYGVVNKDYIYYTNKELSRLFNAKENNYNTNTWISINE